MKKILSLCFATILSLQISVQAQDNVGIGTTTPNASALLDLTSTSKGLLIPRVTLLSETNGTTPVATPATGLLVYNAGGSLATGFWYWNGTKWIQVGAGGATGCTTLDEAYDCGGNGAGRNITVDNGNVELKMPATATNNVAVNMSSLKIGSVGDPVTTLEVEQSGIGLAINAETYNVSNPYNSVNIIQESNISTGVGFTDVGPSGIGSWYEGTGNGVGVFGAASSAGGKAGVFGYNERGNGGHGVFGQGINGVVGTSTGSSYGLDAFGVFGTTNRGVGVQGETHDDGFSGVVGINYYDQNFGTPGYGAGVYGQGFYGVLGETDEGQGYGLFGNNSSTSTTENNVGVGGQGYIGVLGARNDASGAGIYSLDDIGSAGTKSFVIDYPKDPENYILKHYCLEGPKAYNMYRGNVILNSNGEAIVSLPDYFEDININFSYHLTPIGSYANLYIKEKIKDGKFVVAGGVADMEVSWTVYADRNDKYIQTHPESTKDVVAKTRNVGKYLDAKSWNQPEEKSAFAMPKTKQKTISISEKNTNEIGAKPIKPESKKRTK